jgi:hypothetical protein
MKTSVHLSSHQSVIGAIRPTTSCLSCLHQDLGHARCWSRSTIIVSHHGLKPSYLPQHMGYGSQPNLDNQVCASRKSRCHITGNSSVLPWMKEPVTQHARSPTLLLTHKDVAHCRSCRWSIAAPTVGHHQQAVTRGCLMIVARQCSR